MAPLTAACPRSPSPSPVLAGMVPGSSAYAIDYLQRSDGVSSGAFRAQSPSLRFASLMDMDFAVSRPLGRRSRLVPGSCPSTRTFALRFLQTSPRGDSPCVVANPSPPSGWVEDFHLQATEHAQHTTERLRRREVTIAVRNDRGYLFEGREDVPA